MSNNHLTYFKIENFKKFASLEVKDIGQFNLIVGDNNVGKTTLLESLMLGESIKTNFSYLYHFLDKRKIYFDLYKQNKVLEREKNYKENIISFYQKKIDQSINFKRNNDEFKLENANYSVSFEQFPGDYARTESKDNINNFILKHKLYDYDQINKNSQNWIIFYKNQEINYLIDINSIFYNDFLNHENYAPLISFSDGIASDLVDLYDELTDNIEIKESIIDSLNLIWHNQLVVKDIKTETESFVDSGRKQVLLKHFKIATESNSKYHSVNEYGEGFNKSVRIIIEILYNKNQFLCVDEIDVGIHHSKMKDFWNVIFTIASKNNVQIFATTHSKDCMDAIIEASKSNKNQETDIRLIKLTNTKENSIKAITYPFNEFEYLIDTETETR